MTLIKSESGLSLTPEKEAANSLIRHGIIDHLEFLGYEVTANKGLHSVTHPRKHAFSFFSIQPDVLSFYMKFGATDYALQAKTDFYEFINSLNYTSFVSHFSLNAEFDIISHLAYVGEYNKITFARTLEFWELDILALMKHESSRDFV